ncbi:MAG: AAA family ATPase, partial [Novosphingobium sp.]|nr:AAA family ATPase [Novosphingobium sp.]
MANLDADTRGSSPAGRGGAGFYVEGELGAYYLLAMLTGSEARGLPGARIEKIQFQGVDAGYALDDIVIHGQARAGTTVLEIQSKRTVTFAPKDGVFQDVCEQIARVKPTAGVAEARHLLAVATQRTSARISGAYQDLLMWARSAESGSAFFARLERDGVASQPMRDFAATFRANLVTHGVADDDAAIWALLKRFQILEFDFESTAPLARIHAFALARGALAPGEGARAEALWANLIEIALAAAKVGEVVGLTQLRGTLQQRGFELAGNRDFASVRAKLEEISRLALADIGTNVAGIHISRTGYVEAIDTARDGARLVEIRGGPGVGKSSVFRQLAERVAREARVIVLDPIGTPDGGAIAFAQQLAIPATVQDFLTDLAASGGGILFIDNLDMFTTAGKRRTVNDLLRMVSGIPGFTVIATARSDFGREGDSWLAADAVAALGPAHRVEVTELDDAEIALLRAQAPELQALLAPGHPAAGVARNLYRLSRLLAVPDTATIRSEAALAAHWWNSGDGVKVTHVRSAQRLFAALADAALAGEDSIVVAEDSPARAHLLAALSLRETRRDHLAFYHDVLRDWAVGMRLHEDPGRVPQLDLTRPASPRLSRGIELAGRLAIERDASGQQWLALLAALSPRDAHGSWRRHALMAILRSEHAAKLLDRHAGLLLRHGGALLAELTKAIVAADTISAAELFAGVPIPGMDTTAIGKSIRTAASPSAPSLLAWCVDHADQIPIQGLPAVVWLTEILLPLALFSSSLSRGAASMLFGWLMQLDLRDHAVTIPSDDTTDRLDSDSRSRLIEDLRSTALLLAASAPEATKAYLAALSGETDRRKAKAVLPFSQTLARVAPAELAALVEASLVEPPQRKHRGVMRDRSFSFADTDYMPPSPAQPPFLHLLQAAPSEGLGLIRRLTEVAIAYHAQGAEPGDDGFNLAFDDGDRFFPWVQSYFWSRGQGNDYAVASGLMAL